MVALHGIRHGGLLMHPVFPGLVFPLVMTLHLHRIAILHHRVTTHFGFRLHGSSTLILSECRDCKSSG